MNQWFSRISQNCLILKSYFISSSAPFQRAVAHLIKIQHQVMMIGLVQTVHRHMRGFDYHREALSSPPEEVNKNTVNEDRTIQMRQKMSLYVLGNIRSFNNQGSPLMFTCVNCGHEQTHNSFLVTS